MPVLAIIGQVLGLLPKAIEIGMNVIPLINKSAELATAGEAAPPELRQQVLNGIEELRGRLHNPATDQ